MRVQGETIEPRVSLPMAKPTRPAAVAAAEPAEEPLEPWSSFHGLRVVPPNQTSPQASSPSVSLATSTAPAALEPLDDRRVLVDDLVAERPGAPGRAVAAHREEVLGAPRDAVQRPARAAGGELAVHLLGAFERRLLDERDDARSAGS